MIVAMRMLSEDLELALLERRDRVRASEHFLGLLQALKRAAKTTKGLTAKEQGRVDVVLSSLGQAVHNLEKKSGEKAPKPAELPVRKGRSGLALYLAALQSAIDHHRRESDLDLSGLQRVARAAEAALR